MNKRARLLLLRCLACLCVLSGSLQGHAADPADAPPPRLAGKFVWAELATNDLDNAQRFYGGLFGWTFAEVDGYVTAFNGGEPVAGLFYRTPPKDRPVRPRWICLVSAENLADATKAVLAAGGSVRQPAMSLPGLGERVIFADSEGALFGAMRLSQGDPEDYLAETGSWIWLHLLSNDVAKAGRFYQTLGGYDLYDNRKSDQGLRYLLVRDGYARAAITPLSPQRVQEGVKPLWVPFIRVASVAASVAQVPALGGKVVLPPRADFFRGRIAVVEDATGGAVGLMEWDAEPEPESAAEPGRMGAAP